MIKEDTNSPPQPHTCLPKKKDLSHVINKATPTNKMVTGHGARGGRGRCFAMWQEFMKCITDGGTVSLDVCQLQREDYLECLHHQKLVH